MSTTDEVLLPSSDSFWEVDCYKNTVKRTEDGLHNCSELMKLIFERAEIEAKYANKLKAWSKKWNDLIDKGTEYGTNKAVLLGSLLEAESIGDVHNSIRDQLLEVHADLKKWKGDNYKKQLVTGVCKEAKQFEEEFKKAQKPWTKKLGKVQKAKKEYYNACKLEKAASNQATSQIGAANTTEEQVKKLQEKAEKCRRDVDQTKDKYEESLKELDSYKAIYVSDMTEVFEKTQNFEEKRLRYFKDILIGVHTCLDLTKNSRITEIYKQFRQTIDLSDAFKDLRWWSQNHGADMPMNWPAFEEYSAEILTLSRKDKNRTSMLISNHNNDTGSVRGRSVQNSASKREPVHENRLTVHETVTQPTATREAVPQTNVIRETASQLNPVQRQESYDSELNPFKDDADGGEILSRKGAALEDSVGAGTNGKSAVEKMPTINEDLKVSNPFDEDDDEAVDLSSKAGVPVQAVFDYEGQEEDELSFKCGEQFEKLKDRDEQGWCTGRKDGRVGLYPDNYVKPLIP